MGGAENTLYNLVKNDFDNKHMVISLSKPLHFEKKFRKINVKVINFNFENSFLKNFYKLVTFIKKNDPSLIQTWMYHAEFVSIFLKIFISPKILWNIRNSTPYSKSFKLRTRILILFNAFFSYFVPFKIISCSNEATKNHVSIGYCEKFFFYIPNGVDLKKFNFSFRKNLSKKNIIGCVARWTAQKDHKNLIEALNLLLKKGNKNWQCYLAGKGLDKKNDELKKLIKHYSLQHHIKLFGPVGEIHKFYKKINFLVLPSKDGEGFPNVILESYASGVPCIATNIGDVRQVLINKKYLIKPKNYKALFNAILKIFDDKYILSKKNKLNLRKFVSKKYSIQRMLNSYLFIWKKAKAEKI